MAREEDPSTRSILEKRIILAPCVFCVRFKCGKLYLSLALGSSYLRDRNILELGTNHIKMASGRSVGNL